MSLFLLFDILPPFTALPPTASLTDGPFLVPLPLWPACASSSPPSPCFSPDSAAYAPPPPLVGWPVWCCVCVCLFWVCLIGCWGASAEAPELLCSFPEISCLFILVLVDVLRGLTPLLEAQHIKISFPLKKNKKTHLVLIGENYPRRRRPCRRITPQGVTWPGYHSVGSKVGRGE